jgi:hypothetical protein
MLIFYAIFLLVLFSLRELIINIFRLFILKIKFGDNLKIIYNFKGTLPLVREGFQKYDDSLYFFRKWINENPNLKFIANFRGQQLFITLTDPEYV